VLSWVKDRHSQELEKLRQEVANLQEQMEMLWTNQANKALPWSLQTSLHNDSETEEFTTADVQGMTILAVPMNLPNIGVEEIESTTEEAEEPSPPADPLNPANSGTVGTHCTPEEVQDILPPADPPNLANNGAVVSPSPRY
jgi:hypothetical protein